MKRPCGETGAQAVNKNHGETFPRENIRWEEEEMCCVSKFSRTVQENMNSGGLLIVKFVFVLKGALVDIMKNKIDTSLM